MGFLKKLRCWWSHGEHWHFEPMYHAWLGRCSKCGRKWVERD